MSLKTFHIVFVAFSIFLSVGVGVWGFRQYREFASLQGLILSVLGIVSAVILSFYLRKVFRKYKDVSFF